MAKRQETQLFIGVENLQGLRANRHGKHDVRIADLDPFGIAGGARSVNKKASIFWPAFGNFIFKFGWIFCCCLSPDLIELLQRHHIFIFKFMEPIEIKNDHFRKPRHLICDRQVFVQLFVIFHKQKAAVTVIHQIGQLPCAISCINTAGDAANGLDANIGINPFFAVFGENRDNFAAFKP